MPDFPLLVGRYIFLGNPYVAANPPAAWPAPAPAALVYPGVNPLTGIAFNPGEVDRANSWYAPRFDLAECEEYSGHWDFKGVKRYVARAMRIPYMYYAATENPGGTILVTDHFLIGYEGGGAQ